MQVDLATRQAAGPVTLKLVHLPASTLNTKIYSFVEGETCWVASYIDAGLPAGDPSANGVATLSKGTYAFAWDAGMGMEAALAAAPGSVLGRLHGQGQNAVVVECKVRLVSASWLPRRDTADTAGEGGGGGGLLGAYAAHGSRSGGRHDCSV